MKKARKKKPDIVTETDDEVIKIVAQIHERGGELLDLFVEIHAGYLAETLPTLEAMRDSQDATYKALEELREMEVPDAKA